MCRALLDRLYRVADHFLLPCPGPDLPAPPDPADGRLHPSSPPPVPQLVILSACGCCVQWCGDGGLSSCGVRLLTRKRFFDLFVKRKRRR